MNGLQGEQVEDGHHLDQVQVEEGVVRRDQQRAKETKEDD